MERMAQDVEELAQLHPRNSVGAAWGNSIEPEEARLETSHSGIQGG